MAVIGSLGGVVFSVSTNYVKTFDGMKRSSSAKFASHNRHLKDTLLEFTGNDPDKITFSMTLSVFLGVDPQKELSTLEAAKRAGKIMHLVVGQKSYGNWVINSLSEDYDKIDNKGNILIANVSVSLTAYAGR
ncbi:MAG: phage tail protein [Ruminococcus sp.]|nr:phage tail protein [Ruminococcus sp.]